MGDNSLLRREAKKTDIIDFYEKYRDRIERDINSNDSSLRAIAIAAKEQYEKKKGRGTAGKKGVR